jgi:glycosyltransferase involved in cell wall biosynthesis
LLPLANIQGQYSEETILSVLHHIVVDGGSSDQTMEVVNKYKDQIDIIIHEKDKGQIDVINIGFKLEKRELVGWINLMIFFFQFVFENC